MELDDSGNLGTIDRAIRVFVGAALLMLCFLGPQSSWGLLGVLPLVTGIAGECLLYRALGISTTRQTGQ